MHYRATARTGWWASAIPTETPDFTARRRHRHRVFRQIDFACHGHLDQRRDSGSRGHSNYLRDSFESCRGAVGHFEYFGKTIQIYSNSTSLRHIYPQSHDTKGKKNNLNGNQLRWYNENGNEKLVLVSDETTKKDVLWVLRKVKEPEISKKARLKNREEWKYASSTVGVL